MPGNKQHKVTVHTLKNGAEGLLIHIPSATVMSMEINFRAGHFMAKRNKWETPHVMEHMSLGANERFQKARIFEAEFKKNGAYSNASTSNYHINYDAECADFEWERVLDLLTLAVGKPLFTEEEFKAEMGNVRDELVARSNNHVRTLSIAAGLEFRLLSMKDKDRIKSLGNITVKDIRDFYAATHTTRNMRFVIAGKISGRTNKILNYLEKIGLPKGSERIALPDETPRRFEGPLHVRRPSVSNVYFDITTFGKTRFNEADWDAATLANNILTETLYSKILGEARERGLVYSMGSGFELLKTHIGWSVGGQVIKENLMPLLDITVREVGKMLDGTIDAADIDAAKQYALGRFQRGAQTVGGVLNGYAGIYFLENHIDDYYGFPERIKAVKKETIIDVMRRVFADELWGLSTLGTAPKELQDAAHEKVAELWRR